MDSTASLLLLLLVGTGTLCQGRKKKLFVVIVVVVYSRNIWIEAMLFSLCRVLLFKYKLRLRKMPV